MQRYVQLFTCALTSLSLSWMLLASCCQAQVVEIEQLHRRLPTIKDSTSYTDVLNRLSMLYATRSLDSCLYYTLYAKDLAQRNKYDKGLADAYNTYAYYHMEKSNIYLAYKFANQALDIFKKLQDKEGECLMLMNIGVISSRENKTAQAISYYEQAIGLENELTKDSVLTNLYLNLTTAKSRQMDWGEIKYTFSLARAIADKYHDWTGQQQIKLAEAHLMIEKGMPREETIKLLNGLCRETEKGGAYFTTALGYCTLGDIYTASSTDSADFYYQKAAMAADSGKFTNLHYYALSRAFDNVKDKAGYKNKAAKYSKSILAGNQERAYEDQKYGLNLLGAAIQEKDLQIADTNNRLKQTWITFLIAAAVFILLLAIFLFRSYRTKRRFVSRQQLLIAELEAKNNELQENNEFNKKLISVMAHDLRQPFSSIIMLDKTSAKDVMNKEQFIGVINKMRITSEKSIQIMDGLLQWMKLQLLGLEYQATPINLLANIGEALSFNMDMVTQKKVTVHNDINDSLFINAQQEMLLFVNRNIINNALKFSPKNGAVTLKARLSRETIYVSISDTGGGIPPEVMKNLFKSDTGKKQKPGSAPVKGAGIALFICQDMILKMGGHIWAENNPDGAGATFNYSLPTASNQIAAGPLFEINQQSSLN